MDTTDKRVTIDNLEVSFEVEGEGDEAVFATLFEKYIKRWSRLETAMQERQCRFEAERALVDRSRGKP
jgi:hypothetical protein